MKDWFARYHAYILSRGEQAYPHGWHDLQGHTFVWLTPLLVVCLVLLIVPLQGLARVLLVLLAGSISLTGVIWVSVVFMTGFLRKSLRHVALQKAASITKRYPQLLSAEILARYPRPEGNHEEALAIALGRAASCTWRTESEKASSAVMYAIGNDHRGDYRPVVLLILPVLADLLPSTNQWTQLATIEVLSNLWFSHQAEPGFERFQASDADAPVCVEAEVRAAIRDMSAAIEEVAQGKGAAVRPALELAAAMRSADDSGDAPGPVSAT